MCAHRVRILPYNLVLALGVLLSTAQAEADVDMGRLVETWRLSTSRVGSPVRDPFRAMSRRGDGRMRLLVRERALNGTPSAVGPAGMVTLRPGLFAWTATPEEVATLSDARPDLRFSWSAPRRVLLDLAVPLTRADVVQKVDGLTGRGVAVGIVDTGLDVRHADLRRADGTSRIAWLLDLSHEPMGKHPKLEQDFGCNEKETQCAVFSGADLDELMSNSVTNDEPRDTFGHGTHVASLAAGNGLSSPQPKYVGMAPEATIVAVRATRDDSGLVEDPDILAAVKFIFHVADEELKLPVVANLSLGGDFGAHDGTSDLERELGQYVGGTQPGHSIVVAAGNGGSLYQSPFSTYPEPFGIHTVVHVPPESSVRVPVFVGKSAEPKLPSYLYVWIASRPGDWLKVGLDHDDGTWISPVDLGGEREAEDPSGDYTGTIQNGITESDDPESVDHSGAVVLVEGPFPRERFVALRLEGYGTASIWVQSAGGIDVSVNGVGALLPGAQREGTISIPATSPALISVGASLNRVAWTDVDGIGQVSPLVSLYSQEYLRPDSVLSFSAAGPTATDVLKPDLIAPGGWVAGAMSQLTDPRTLVGGDSMFAGTATECAPVERTVKNDCQVVDNAHALSTGTSMASPIVAGAVALLLQSNSQLTQPELAAALRAGAKAPLQRDRTTAQLGAGMLDVKNALSSLRGEVSGNAVDPDNSWIGLGNAYAHPDPDWPIPGFVHLRDSADVPVDVAPGRLHLRVENGRVLSKLQREAPGFYRFTAAAEAFTAGQSLTIELLVDDKAVSEVTREIDLDASSDHGPPAAGRGCAQGPGRPSGGELLWLGLVLGAAITHRRRATSSRHGRSALRRA